MDSRYYLTLEKYVREGDLALVYRHGGTFPASVQIKGNYYYDERDIGWTKNGKPYVFPYRVNLEILKESRTPPQIAFSLSEDGMKAKWSKPNLIDDISFIADKGRTWNQYLQVSIIAIPRAVFETVSSVL